MKTAFLLAVAAVGSIAAAPLWQTPGLIGELKLDRERTASRWIWTNGRPRDNEVALFRFAFEADSPVSSGRLSFASDDIGHLYLNGTEIHPSKFAAAVKPGRNVMAVCVTNVYSMGGMIAFGDFTLKSGRTLGLRSCAAFKAWDAGVIRAKDYDAVAHAIIERIPILRKERKIGAYYARRIEEVHRTNIYLVHDVVEFD